MHCIKYKVCITYREIDGKMHTRSYEFASRDKHDAEVVAREIFFSENGVFPDMQIWVVEVLPNEYELTKVNRSVVSDFPTISNMFKDITYGKFIDLFITLEGWGFKVLRSTSYWFKFRNFVCKAEFKNGKSFIDTEEVLYYGDRLYVLRNNLMEVYIGGGV